MKVRATDGDRGSASVWVLACGALLLVAAMTATLRTTATLARHRAEFAADAAALAAAAQIGTGGQPCASASAIAIANGSRVRTCELRVTADARAGQVAITVVTAVNLPILGSGTVQASARAEREGPVYGTAH